MGNHVSLVAQPPCQPVRESFLAKTGRHGVVAGLPVLAVWATALEFGVPRIAVLCRQCSGLQPLAVRTRALYSCAELEELFSNCLASAEQASLQLLFPSVPSRARAITHAFLVEAGVKRRRAAGAAKVVHVLHSSFRQVLLCEELREIEAFRRVFPAEKVEALLAAADPPSGGSASSAVPTAGAPVTFRSSASSSTALPSNELSRMDAHCAKLMAFFRAHLVLATRHAQVRPVETESTNVQATSSHSAEFIEDVLREHVERLGERAPAAAAALSALRARYSINSERPPVEIALMVPLRGVCKALRETPVCLPLAAQYNAEARAWREKSLAQLCYAVEANGGLSAGGLEALAAQIQEQGIQLNLNAAQEQLHDEGQLREWLEQAVRRARPDLLESLPRPGDEIEAEEATVFLTQCSLLPSALSGLIIEAADGAEPACTTILSSFGTLQPWLEFVSRRYRLTHFQLQSKSCSEDRHGGRFLEVCAHASFRRSESVDWCPPSRDEATLLSERGLPRGRFGPELPVLFDGAEGGAKNNVLVRRPAPRCCIL